MLVLTRKIGQKLIIADNIEITVLETRGDIVKLGINAPKSISIFREELYEEIKRSNQQATEHPGSLDDIMNLIPKLPKKKPPNTR